MSFNLVHIPKEKWVQDFAKHVHLSVFGKDESEKEEGLDYALFITHLENPVIYTTIKEAGKKTAVLEYGGSFPDYRASHLTYTAFVYLVERLKETYDHVFMIIRNDNFSMLKFALKSKFKITGISTQESGAPLLEHRLTFDKEK